MTETKGLMPLDDRIRRVNVDKLKNKQIDMLSEQIGDKLGKILQSASNDANKLLNVYGLEIKVDYNIIEKK